MKDNISAIKNKMTPVRLHLELKDDYLSDYQKRMLRRYGESTSGDSITRDILIPSDMPLHNLHYAIQKLFGWQNSHLRSFYLPEEIYNKLTGDTVKGWSDLVGILFQPPSEGEEDIFWDDDYEKGSFKVWLRKKYTGPYIYGGTMEYPEVARLDVQELLERLEVNKVIAAQGEDIVSKGLFPITKELIYNYDFGDNWIIKITKYKDCEDLLKNNIIDEYGLEEAEDIVLDKHKPVCIHKDGILVLDDVGGLSGFADFLGVLYEGEDKEEITSAHVWAKSLGWSATKVSNKMML